MGCGGSTQSGVSEFENPNENYGYKAKPSNIDKKTASSTSNGLEPSAAGNKTTVVNANSNDAKTATKPHETDSDSRKTTAKNNRSAPVQVNHGENDTAKPEYVPTGEKPEYQTRGGKPELQSDSTPQENDDSQSDTESFADLDLISLNIPDVVQESRNQELTIDDIIDHNNEIGSRQWFSYARKVYNRSIIIPIVKDRVDQCAQKLNESPISSLEFGYPIYPIRQFGVSRQALVKVLHVAQVGVRVDLPREEYLWRMKQSAEDVRDDGYSAEYAPDYHDLILRWLAVYPDVSTNTVTPSGDPNLAHFPLPDKFRRNPGLLQNWIKKWVRFDMAMPQGGAWIMMHTCMGGMGDTHPLYAELIAGEHRDDPDLPPMDTEVDGVVAWEDMEVDIMKNDVTTEEQDAIIKSRAGRNDLFDEDRMRRRRARLAKGIAQRHNHRVSEQNFYNVADISDSYIAEYLGWADRLEREWDVFQKICKNEFRPPQRYVDLYSKYYQDKASEAAKTNGTNAPYESSPGNESSRGSHKGETGPDVLKP